METYSIWLDNAWVPVEAQMALDKLGLHIASFNPVDVMFFDAFLPSDSCATGTLFNFPVKIASFTVSETGDRLFALQSCLIKHEYDKPRWRYLISPRDFLDTDKTRSVLKSIGSPDAYLIGS